MQITGLLLRSAGLTHETVLGSVDSDESPQATALAQHLSDLDFFTLPPRIGGPAPDDRLVAIRCDLPGGMHSVAFPDNGPLSAQSEHYRTALSLREILTEIIGLSSNALRQFDLTNVAIGTATIGGRSGEDTATALTYSAEHGFVTSVRLNDGPVTVVRPTTTLEAASAVQALRTQARKLTELGQAAARTLVLLLESNFIPDGAPGDALRVGAWRDQESPESQ